MPHPSPSFLWRLALVAVVVGLAACGRIKPPEELIDVTQTDGGAEAVDPAVCAGLDECTCSATPGCAPLTTGCWCPPAACGSTTACACTGGRYLGCNPRRRGCQTQCGLFADPAPARDERGCLSCVDPADCATAAARLPSVCPGAPAVDTQWLCNGSYGPCATICVVQLDSCQGASCALCQSCICSNDLFSACLSECLDAMQSRR